MTRSEALRRLKRSHWRGLERLVRHAWQEGFEAGLAQAHGQKRRGRPIRDDATVAGLVRRIERHFGLDRFGFEVRIVHAASGRRVKAADALRTYRLEAD